MACKHWGVLGGKARVLGVGASPAEGCSWGGREGGCPLGVGPPARGQAAGAKLSLCTGTGNQFGEQES